MGCGMTRAFGSMTHLELAQSFRYHPLAFALLLYFIVAWIRYLFRVSSKGGWWHYFGKYMFIAFLVLYSGRMVSFFSSPEGLASPLTKNIFARVITGDFYDPPEPWNR
jgi:hypothetical protein